MACGRSILDTGLWLGGTGNGIVGEAMGMGGGMCGWGRGCIDEDLCIVIMRNRDEMEWGGMTEGIRAGTDNGTESKFVKCSSFVHFLMLAHSSRP